ncbi:hypothetical protein PPYR_07079 [Photinus pyralis]|uniref:Actin-related protein 10 n=1 Tax=Photinus pyralis TaxID=7054 RepID=A0A1Y1NJ28_PHOPY|nr:actin-related protein 10 [Photinus pyralis]KAB0799199.1 hypothetical protein PPYR_07079 [Photinus pyralis]
MPIYEGIGAITDKLVVVMDIGAAYTKLGFSGEFSPRYIIRSEVRCKETGLMRNIRDYKDDQDLYDLLVDFLHSLYFKYVLISPKDRPVVVVESLLCPTIFRETLAKVLFCHYEVSMILVVPSHLVCLASLGIDTALVLDVGFSEAVAIPVCHGLPVIHAWQALPLASQAVHINLKSMLTANNTGISSLSEWELEDIKVRCCFVTPKDRAMELSKTTPSLTACPDVTYPLQGSKSITVLGKVRETVYETFFQEDNDHQCVSTMLLDAILKVNLDLRLQLAENIVIMGGTAMAPGLKSRLKEELYEQLKKDRYSKLKIKVFKFHSPPCKDNYTSWLGGAIYGCTELLGMKGLTRENYLKENRLPDWANMRDNLRTL